MTQDQGSSGEHVQASTKVLQTEGKISLCMNVLLPGLAWLPLCLQAGREFPLCFHDVLLAASKRKAQNYLLLNSLRQKGSNE